jgi:hypothetical protein
MATRMQIIDALPRPASLGVVAPIPGDHQSAAASAAVTHHEVVTQPIELAEQTADPDALLRLAADFRLDRLNVAVAARVLSNPAAPSDAQALCRGDRDVVALDGCSFAAGANLGLAPGEPVVLVFGRDDVYFVVDDEEDLVLSVPVEAVTRVEISGPGRQIKGGGFYGGAGIGGLLGGPQGALDGVLLTTFLNGLSRGATVTSFSRVSGPGWEAIFVNGQREPEQLGQLLSPAFVRGRTGRVHLGDLQHGNREPRPGLEPGASGKPGRPWHAHERGLPGCQVTRPRGRVGAGGVTHLRQRCAFQTGHEDGEVSLRASHWPA